MLAIQLLTVKEHFEKFEAIKNEFKKYGINPETHYQDMSILRDEFEWTSCYLRNALRIAFAKSDITPNSINRYLSDEIEYIEKSLKKLEKYWNELKKGIEIINKKKKIDEILYLFELYLHETDEEVTEMDAEEMISDYMEKAATGSWKVNEENEMYEVIDNPEKYRKKAIEDAKKMKEIFPSFADYCKFHLELESSLKPEQNIPATLIFTVLRHFYH